MSRLQLRLLGSPEVRYAGQVLTLPTRKTLALLVYLAVEGGRHSREQLTALLWPESNSAQGRAALRSTLARLNEVLHAATPAPPPLLIEHDTLSFPLLPGIDLDVQTLQAAWMLARVPSP